MANAVSARETIARLTVELGADGSKLAPEMAAALSKAKGELAKANKEMERAQASTMKAVQGHIDKINATRPTNEMRMLEQAVGKLGGTASLTKDQLKRVTLEVNALAAAGAKVPASLSNLTGMGSKLGAAFQSLTTGGGVSGAVAAIGPAGVAAAGALGALTLAGGFATRQIADLAGQAEQWSNIAASTGLGIETVQRLSAMLEDAGIPAEALKKAMKALSDEIAGGGKQLAQFGISVKGWDLMTQEERLRAFAAIIRDIQDPAIQSAVAVAGLGKSGADLIPVMSDVASGAYKMYDALGPASTAALLAADKQIDTFTRKLKDASKRLIASGLELAQGLSFGPGGIPIFTGSPGAAVAGAAAAAKPPEESQAEKERQARAKEYAGKAAREKADKETEKSLEKQKDKQQEIADLLQKQLDSARKLAFEIMKAAQAKTPAFTKTLGIETIPQARNLGLGAMVGAKNYDFGIDAQGFVTWGDAAKDAAGNAKKAETETKTWSDSLDSLAQQLNVLANTTGGLTGKLVGFAASLASGLGGAISGFKGMTSVKDKGLLGFLGKASGALGMVGSAVGVVGSLIGGIKSLFGGKSKEQKAAEAAAKKQAEEDKKQAAIQAAEEKKSALLSAKGFAESLMDAISKGGISAKLSTALQAIVGKIGEALLSSGLGILDERLRKSEAYQTTTQLGADVAGALGAASQAGIYDTGLAAAGGAAAQGIMGQAIADATAAGLTGQEAQKAGFAAVANILREQLNASIRSGQELDANTQQLIEEAKANGIQILADPAIESLGVQKEQLGVLKAIAGQRGGETDTGGATSAARGFGPMITPNLGGGFGPRIQTHAGEYAMVIPRSRVGPEGILSAATGIYSPLAKRGSWGRPGSTVTVNLAVTSNPWQTQQTAQEAERRILRTVERKTARNLGALIAARRA